LSWKIANVHKIEIIPLRLSWRISPAAVRQEPSVMNKTGEGGGGERAKFDSSCGRLHPVKKLGSIFSLYNIILGKLLRIIVINSRCYAEFSALACMAQMLRIIFVIALARQAGNICRPQFCSA